MKLEEHRIKDFKESLAFASEKQLTELAKYIVGDMMGLDTRVAFEKYLLDEIKADEEIQADEEAHKNDSLPDDLGEPF